MKTKELTIEFFQKNGVTVVTKFNLNVDAKNSLIIGTAINELFTLQNNYRKANLRLFKTSEPVLFKVSNENETLLNVGLCSRAIQDKLKFNKTAKSMSRFAKRVNLAVTELQRAIKVIDYADVENAILSIID